MAKKTAPPTDSIVIDNTGPIDHLEIKLLPGRVTLITGNNGTGKSEALNAVNALIGREADVTLKDGATEGRITGFGREIKITAKQSRKTGELDVQVAEEGFSISGFVKPGFKTPEANDKQRLKNLASCLRIQVDKQAVYSLVGGRDVYQSIVSEKTVDAKDPADYVSSLKRDCDAQALEHQRIAEVLEAEANTLEESLPTETGESDSAVLAGRLTDAMNHKRDLIAKQDAAEEMRRRAESAGALIAAGQGQSVEQAQKELERATSVLSDLDEMVLDLETRLTQAKQNQAVAASKQESAQQAVDAATDRQRKIQDAQEHLKATTEPPNDADIEAADAEVRKAEAAMTLGSKIREAVVTWETIEAKRAEASGSRETSERLRGAAQKALSLLVDPINTMGVGIAVDEQMRLVVTEHRRGKAVYIDKLSEGERVALAIRLLVKMAGGEEMPAIVALDQTFYEASDFNNRKILIDEVAKTKLMVVVAEAARKPMADGEFETQILEGAI